MQIVREIEKSSAQLTHLLETSTLQEGAGALLVFLTGLKRPLIPDHIQSLALGMEKN